MKWKSLFIYSLLLSLWSCTDSTKKPEEAVSNEPNKQTQALLLTQDFAYDPADKNKVTSDYVAQSQIEVPSDLATQSKWIMFEGPVLENDLIAYRYYADSRHRFDIYGKTVPDLVMDTVSWQYHDIMDWGSDILKVGNSLGLGSPAIWYQDSLYTLSDCARKTIEITENGDQRSAIRTTFYQLNIAGETFDLIQDWSIETGQAWSEIHLQLIDGELPEGMSFATGIVKHLPTISTGNTDEYFYAFIWGKLSFHVEIIGMAITAKRTTQPVAVEDELSHAYAFQNAKQAVRYRFLSAWERDNNGVSDTAGFRQLVEQAASN
mgnify:CR=1 FL=1